MVAKTISFADIAHQNLVFDCSEEESCLILELLTNRWMQRLRRVSQTGNSKLVYMFAEHSRFGHSLGVAYLATTLLRDLSRIYPDQVGPYRNAVAAAALLHDIGHLAPGSHLAEHVWAPHGHLDHEAITVRIIKDDPEIRQILESYSPTLAETVCSILEGDKSLPEWTVATISGDGWNADRGNWSIVDSALCAVSYGRYNVSALLDSFRLTPDGKLVLAENRVDALSHFFVARDSMYRQIYQHRVSQSADVLTAQVIKRLRDLLQEDQVDAANIQPWAEKKHIFCDKAMASALLVNQLGVNQLGADQLGADQLSDAAQELALSDVFRMTEDWWSYHIAEWCGCQDLILKDLARRLRDRVLLKTIRVESPDDPFIARAKEICQDQGFDPNYYCLSINSADLHRTKLENPPLVLLDNGETVPVTEIEPLIANLFQKSFIPRVWIAVPNEVKAALGRPR